MNDVPKPIIYTDGGTIGHPPSRKGGVWAYVAVSRKGKVLDCKSGLVTPEELGLTAISADMIELYAVLMALSKFNDRAGTIITDSENIKRKLTSPDGSLYGVSDDIQKMFVEAKKRFKVDPWFIKLAVGHPTAIQLKHGTTFRGRICSRWHMLCDKLCNDTKKQYRENFHERVGLQASHKL